MRLRTGLICRAATILWVVTAADGHERDAEAFGISPGVHRSADLLEWRQPATQFSLLAPHVMGSEWRAGEATLGINFQLKKLEGQRGAYCTQEHAAAGVFSQKSTRQDLGLCVAVQADPWMK